MGSGKSDDLVHALRCQRRSAVGGKRAPVVPNHERFVCSQGGDQRYRILRQQNRLVPSVPRLAGRRVPAHEWRDPMKPCLG